MPPLKNQRQELFCQYVFTGESPAYECAVRAGYALKAARSTASHLSTNHNIRARIDELNAAAASARVMTVQERKEKLSEIGRARLTDYMSEDSIKVGKDSPNASALQSLTKNTRKIRNAIISEEVTDIKLHSPIAAIQELNKMEHIYYDTTVNIQNTQVIIVNAKEKILSALDRLASTGTEGEDNRDPIGRGSGEPS
jgi:phage terminase small subunit